MQKSGGLRKNEVAELLGVHRNTVANLLAKGELAGTNLRDVMAYVRKMGREDAVAAMIEKMQEVKGT